MPVDVRTDCDPHFTRRQKELARRIVSIAHSACDEGRLEIASDLLHVVDILMRPGETVEHDERQVAECTIMAHERLWLIRRSHVS